jgi:hypothetical protein
MATSSARHSMAAGSVTTSTLNTSLSSPCSSVMPFFCIASACAPRAISTTSIPARNNCAPTTPPMAPAP